MKPPYYAMDVANYIVAKANEREKKLGRVHSVTHLKLQKLLYYVVAKYAKDFKINLIDENVVKWQFGPVVKSVYHAFKTYGSEPIKEPYGYLTKNSIYTPDENGKLPEIFLEFAKPDEINQQLMSQEGFVKVVDAVLDELLNCDPFALVERTHQEEAWLSEKSAIFARARELEYTLDELQNANI